MKKPLLFFLFAFFLASIQAQLVVYENDISLKPYTLNLGQAFVLNDTSLREIPIFLYEDKNLYMLKMNEDLSYGDLFLFPKSDIPYRYKLLEAIVDKQGHYQLLFINPVENRFIIESVNPQTQTSTFEKAPFQFDDEGFLGSCSQGDTMHILSVQREPAGLELASFKGDQFLGIKQIREVRPPDGKPSALSAIQFFRTLYDERYDRRNKNSFGIIRAPFPALMPTASRQAKMYIQGNQISLSLDNDPGSTQLVRVDVQKQSFYIQSFKQQKISCKDPNKVQTNSFLLDDLLFQLVACREELYASVYDLSKGKRVKEFRFTKNGQATFANTPIYFKNADGRRKISKSKKALKKLSKMDAGIYALLYDGKLEMTIGGYQLIENSGGSAPIMTPGSSVSTPYGNVSMGPNITYMPFNPFSQSKILSLTSLLDPESLKKVNDDFFPHPYERMLNHRIENGSISLLTFFKRGDSYYRCYIPRRDEKFIIKKFN